MRDSVKSLLKLLTFRLSRDGFLEFNKSHLLLGLFCTWIVGIGRWWDDPGANVLQRVGLGSIAYVFLLALLLWVVILPLGPQNWSYKHVLTFVSMTSPPAILYAIPVERFTELKVAREINVWFLAFAACWRVALLLFYLKRYARLTIFTMLIATLLPITAIIVVLTALNLERAVFDVMGGLRETGTANDSAYGVLFGLSFLSVMLFPLLFICYVVMIALSKGRE